MELTLHLSGAIRPTKSLSQPRWARISLLSVLGYEALGCFVGGSFLIAGPDGHLMDMPVRILHGAFPDFFIPGIILFGLGVLNAIGFFAVLRHSHYDWLWSWLSVGGLTIWFIVEIAVIREIVWLHYMWGFPVYLGALAAIPLLPWFESWRKAMLGCGILSSVLYVAMNIFVPLGWPEYNSSSQTVSELSAVGAPTRAIWVWLGLIYELLTIAFAWGVWSWAGSDRKLRITGALLLAYAGLGVLWPFAPMHLREVLAAGGGTWQDTMHLTLGAVTEVIYLVALFFAAAVFGKNFRNYSIVTVVVLFVFGALTFLDAPNVGTNSPTPFIGLWERINIGVFLAWMVVLALEILRIPHETVYKRSQAGSLTARLTYHS